ncbi:shikimate kinase [Niveibacterium microcysteis]|uniref:Shikimate kinase n=1 Tax=Niveibacterium microcysteis TaxID=2811415 RepID=A0ABX7M5R2_9RHOO|nr:shikimate kinase [Niveibacterium microcysteis]QSI76769.1 shikimate kinase [Niveibacterium microcysteis]
MKNVVLVGLMGSGKTTIGRLLARRLLLPFVDSDHEVELRTGVRIPTIFDVEGEAGFRRREALTIAALMEAPGIVLATGGGAVLDAGNRNTMKRNGWVVYLDVPVRQLYERTRNDPNRPLLRVPDPLGRLEELRRQRDPLYREVADFILDGSRYHSSSAVNRILKEWEKQSASST